LEKKRIRDRADASHRERKVGERRKNKFESRGRLKGKFANLKEESNLTRNRDRGPARTKGKKEGKALPSPEGPCPNGHKKWR